MYGLGEQETILGKSALKYSSLEMLHTTYYTSSHLQGQYYSAV